MRSAILRLEYVTKTYHLGGSTVQALNNINFTLYPEEMVALQGPSGSGKSTLLNISGLIDHADKGQTNLQGIDITHLSKKEYTTIRRKNIGFIFQTFNLIPVMSAFENIEYPLLLTNTPRKTRMALVNQLLEQVGLTEFKHHRPDRLSGGQRQRVAIARALVKKPKLVIADEPTASLDSHTASQIVELLKTLCLEFGSSILVATHDTRMSDHCHRMVNLEDGKIK
ncbi:MAG: ABC transporter ATP-binding protein [Gammaproteobacteria bacterium]|nr:ABC transporter ATP-binding protein [Gammaproteobacteria bacterium]MDH5730601.1 ABC transporter ATP-binding protein [Gammaproteobacteria bacterium]